MRPTRISRLVLWVLVCWLVWGGLGVAATSLLVSGDQVEGPLLPGVDVVPYVLEGDVWLASPAGDASWRLTQSGQAWYPRLSPDGSCVAYLSLAPAESLASDAELWVADLSTGTQRRLATAAPPFGAPSWAPDGQRLAWATGDQLLLIDSVSGRSSTLVSSLGLWSTERPEPAWSVDGLEIICPLGDAQGQGLWAIALDGTGRRLLSSLPSGAWVSYAVSAAGQVALWEPAGKQIPAGEQILAGEQTPASLRLLALDDPASGAVVAANSALPAVVAQLVWSPDGASLALLSGTGEVSLLSGTPWAIESVAELASTATRLDWLADGRLVVWVRGSAPRDELPLLISLAEHRVQPLCAIPPQVEPQAAPSASRGLAAELPYDWYRYQGEWDSGTMAHNNCGPTCVAMAIQFARDNLWVNISTIRAYIGGSSWTYPEQLQAALSHWQVPNQRLTSLQEINEAITQRGSIVLLHLWMYYFPPGADYLVSYSDPANHYDRYYAYDQSHWVILKGISPDGLWAICHDPNVWDGNSTYWYSGAIPKGKDRYYRYSELASSAAAYGYQAIEVFAESAEPTATPVTPTPSLTPSPTPTGQPLPGRIEWVTNGGFERTDAWIFPVTAARGRRTADLAHQGSWSALLGILPGEQDVFSYSTVHQRIHIPATGRPIVLSFWYRTGTQETTMRAPATARWDGYTPLRLGPVAQPLSDDPSLWSNYDWQRMLILDTAYQVEQVLLSTCEDSGEWRHFTADLSAYAGSDVVLYFEVVNNGTGQSTWMYVDDVSVRVEGMSSVALPMVLNRVQSTPALP